MKLLDAKESCQLRFKPSKALRCCWNLFKINEKSYRESLNDVKARLISSEDRDFLKLLKEKYLKEYEHSTDNKSSIDEANFKIENCNLKKEDVELYEKTSKNGCLILTLKDLHWIRKKLIEMNQSSTSRKCYFHEVFRGTEIILPQAVKAERSEELEKRCQILRQEQENLKYRNMTKNVNCCSKDSPEESVASQIKTVNRYLVVVIQFVITVLSGFVFGVFGTEWIIGRIDLGERILCGIFCAVIIAIAEIYFMLKMFNREEE